MCRLLVFTVDQDNRRLVKSDNVWKRGDVVAVHEDGVSFGKGFEVDKQPAVRIIELPGVPAGKYLYLTSPETETIEDPFTSEPVTIPVRKCMFKIDIDGMETKEVRPAGEKLTTLVEADLAPVEKAPLKS